MYDPTRPLNGQVQPQVPATPVGNISREEFDANDNARLQRKFGMAPVQEELPNMPQVDNNFNSNPAPQYVEPNPFTGMTEQQRTEIINSYAPETTVQPVAPVQPSTVVETPSINQQNDQSSSEGDMFDDIFGSSTPATDPVNTMGQPQETASQPEQPQVDPRAAFHQDLARISLDKGFNPNDVIGVIDQLSNDDLVSLVAEKMQRNTGVPQQGGFSQPNLGYPVQQQQISNLDRLAQTPIVIGGGEEQVPVVSSGMDYGNNYDEY